MKIITMTTNKNNLIKAIAKYYQTQPENITTEKDNVFIHGRKTKGQIDKYKNKFVFAII